MQRSRSNSLERLGVALPFEGGHLGAVLVTADAALLAYGRQGHQGVLMPE